MSCLRSTSCLCLSPPHFFCVYARVSLVYHYCLFKPVFSRQFSVASGLYYALVFSPWNFPLPTLMAFWILDFTVSLKLAVCSSTVCRCLWRRSSGGEDLPHSLIRLFTLDRIGSKINKAPPTRSGYQVSGLQVSGNV